MELDVKGALLAGGRGTRMGSGDAALKSGKLDLDINGTSLAARAFSGLKTAFPDAMVVAGKGGPPVSLAGAISVTDEETLSGPAAGIVAAISLAPGWCFVAAADMPFIDGRLIREMLTAIAALPKGVLCALPVWRKGEEPLHAFYHRDAADAIRDYSGSGLKSLSGMAKALDAVRIDAEEAASRCGSNLELAFLNVNTLEDLLRARQISYKLGI